MKLSIIVPVYNVEKYLNECVESLLNQNYQNYEILLIDDGSLDKSGQICDDYANKYDIIKTYHKKNSGLSDTRNFGIKEATGDYLMFVDSDDYIEKKILNEIMNNINTSKPEILITRLSEKFDDDIIDRDDNIIQYIDCNKKDDALRWILEESFNTWPAVKYIISKDFILKHNLFFKVGYLHEDMEWTSLICIYGESFSFFEPAWYYHRMNRVGSITNKINEKRIIDVIKMSYEIICGKYKNDLNYLNKSNKKMLIKRISQSLYPLLIKSIYVPNEKVESISLELKEKKEILNYGFNFKHKLFSILVRIFGLSFLIKILKKGAYDEK